MCCRELRIIFAFQYLFCSDRHLSIKVIVYCHCIVASKLLLNVFRVCIAWYKHERCWENSRQLCKPETKERICITVENSRNTSSVYIRLCKHRKNVFYCFYKITLPRKKLKNSLLRHWLKQKFLPVPKSWIQSLARVISSCFAKRCFPKYGFFSLKMSALAEKNWDSLFVKIFEVSADEGMGK